MSNFTENKKEFEELLTYNPFQQKNDFFFLSENIQEIFTILKNILLYKNGCGAIIGEKGTGKTTVIHKFINEYLKDSDYIYLIGSSISTDELFKEIMEYFADEKINPDIPIKENIFFEELIKFLKTLKEKKQRLFIILDDAQNFPDEIFDVIEKICNLTIGKEKAISVILLGDKKLEKKLNSTRHKNLRYQLKFFLHLQNLTLEEVDKFIKEFFFEKGIDVKIDKNITSIIYEATKGNLEILNRVLNNLVDIINENNLKKLNKKTIFSVLDQLGLEFPKEKKKIPRFVLLGLIILFGIGLYLLTFNKEESKKIETLQEVINKEKTFGEEKKPEPPKIFEEQKENSNIKIANDEKVSKEQKKEEKPVEKILKEPINNQEKNEIPLTITEETPLKKTQTQQEEQFNEVFDTLRNEVSNISQKIYENYEKAVVLTKTLSLRKGPGTNYKKILDLLKNETVIVVDDTKEKWAKVIYKKDNKEIEGWVYKKFIKKIPKGMAVVVAPFLSLREKPTSKSKRIDKIPKGELVQLLGEQKGNWVKVKYIKNNEEKVGWVSKHFIVY